VNAPFRTITVFHSLDFCSAIWILFVLISSTVILHNRAISPSWGVITKQSGIFFCQSGIWGRAFNPSASINNGTGFSFHEIRIRWTRSNTLGDCPNPGPMTNEPFFFDISRIECKAISIPSSELKSAGCQIAWEKIPAFRFLIISGATILTYPQPALNAAIPESLGAPIYFSDPPTIVTVPNVLLFPSSGLIGRNVRTTSESNTVRWIVW